MSKRNEKFVPFFIFKIKNCTYNFFFRGDRQMTEIFVSVTEVFSEVEMTESPYE